MSTLHFVRNCVVVLIVLTLIACQGDGQAPGSTTSRQAAIQAELQRLEQLSVPAGADPATFTALRAGLRDMLLEQLDSKQVSAAPASNRSQVTDLHAFIHEEGYRFTWTYRNEGDFNLDGIVNVQDLTPLGVYFGATTASANWSEAQAADGNGDGGVNLADLVSIGANFLRQVTNYGLCFNDAPGVGTGWIQMWELDFTYSTVAAGKRTFEYTNTLVGPGYYCATPYHDTDAGIAGREIHVMDPAPGDWYMYNRDRQHSGRSAFTGPEQGELKWTYDAEGPITTGITFYSDGSMFMGHSNPDNMAECSLLSLHPDGGLRFDYVTGKYMHSTPAIALGGVIYFGGGTCLYALNPDASLKWIYDVGNEIYSSPAVSSAGISIVVASYDGTLFCFDNTGAITWSAPIGDDVLASPAIDPEQRVFIGCGDCNLYAFDNTGTQLWSCYTGSHLIGLESSPTVAYNEAIYVGNWNSNLYAVDFDGTLLWTYTTNAYITATPALGPLGRIYIGNNGASLYVAEADGTDAWHAGTGGNITKGVAIDEAGTVYFGTPTGQLKAYNTSGIQKWALDFGPEHMLGAPSIGADGMIVVASDEGTVFGVGEAD